MDDYALVLNAGVVKPEVLRLAAADEKELQTAADSNPPRQPLVGVRPPPGTILDATDI